MISADLSIIIVNWKSQAFVRQCLASIYSNKGTLVYEVFVVDNASYDGCEQMLKLEFPQVIFIQSEQNIGFSGANNLAFAKSTAPSVLFLNPDTEIRGSAIQRLLSSLRSIPDAGMVGARLLNSDLSLQTTCITAVPSILNQTLNSNFLRRSFPKWKIWGMQALFENNRGLTRVEAISGACMLARRDLMERVGCFSTEYFMYAEDMDLCVKVADAGWHIYFVPDALIVHHGGGSSSSRNESNFSNIVLRESLVRFLMIHRGAPYVALYRASIVFVSAFRIFLLLLASPVMIIRSGYGLLRHTLSKWCSILAWSLGLNPSNSPKPQLRSGIITTEFEKLPEV
jgi:N-acetylglucosaminyl-diphospho-decaprenol L-rhamnosyltransferase